MQRSTPVVTTSPTLCDECDCTIPTGAIVFEHSVSVPVERHRIVREGPSCVCVNGVPHVAHVVVSQTYIDEIEGLEVICLDCASLEELARIKGVRLTYTDVTPTPVEPTIVDHAVPCHTIPQLHH